jgi:Flp pilus assembly protein TadB
VGLIGMLVTGWVAAGLGAAAVVLVAPSLLRPSAASKAHIARLEALASWTRRLADLLASGAAQTLPDALARAAVTSPAPIGMHTAALAARMGPQGVERALRQFAKEIADPVGDHVTCALIVRHRHGGIGLADVLSALSMDVDEQVRMRRGILSEQTKAISNVRGILTVTVVFLVLLAVFARPYMAPYSSVAGQVALGGIVSGFGLTLSWLHRLSRPVVGARFLQDVDEPTSPPAGRVPG